MNIHAYQFVRSSTLRCDADIVMQDYRTKCTSEMIVQPHICHKGTTQSIGMRNVGVPH